MRPGDYSNYTPPPPNGGDNVYSNNYNSYNINTNTSSLVLAESLPLIPQDEKKEKLNVFQQIVSFFFSNTEESYVDVLLQSNFLLRAIKFLPALLITFGIELANSAVLGNNQDILQQHFTLVLFIPVISAIAGNIGLQTSSSVTAYINLRLVDGKPVKTGYLLGKYTAHCMVQLILLSILMGIMAAFWYRSPCQYAYGVIVFCGAFVNMSVASCAGVWTPIILNKFGYDPSSGAGPFETALQDVIGAIFFVWFARMVLSADWPKGCELFPDSSEAHHF